jgi:hypothetical protein
MNPFPAERHQYEEHMVDLVDRICQAIQLARMAGLDQDSIARCVQIAAITEQISLKLRHMQ